MLALQVQHLRGVQIPFVWQGSASDSQMSLLHFHRFGFCVFRTLDRAVRECVPYGCAFLTKGNAAR